MKKSILVCDDDAGILDVVTIILEEMGHHVTAINDSQEVLSSVHQNPPDLILLDLWMPNISGEELTLRLKEKAHTQHIPIVIVSASKDTEKIALTAGANSFITKPFDILELEEVVSKYLETKI